MGERADKVQPLKDHRNSTFVTVSRGWDRGNFKGGKKYPSKGGRGAAMALHVRTFALKGGR